MTSPDPMPPDDLQALFDRTAEPPTGAQLTKLAARAAEVPGRARGRAWWPAWIAAPGLAAAAAVALVLTWPDVGVERPGVEGRVAQSSATQQAAPQLSAPIAIERVASSEAVEGLATMGTTAMFSLETDDFDPLGGSLEGPDADGDLDAWLAAADEILSGG